MKVTVRVEEKVFVAVDEDAHFHVILLKDRHKVWNFLRTAFSGDYWANELDEHLEEVGLSAEEVLVADEATWEIFVRDWCRRGLFELINL